MARLLLLVGVWAGGGDHARAQVEQSAPVVLVQTPDLDGGALQTLSGLMRVQLGPGYTVRIVDGSPPAAADERAAWAGQLLEGEGAASVMWVRHETPEMAHIVIVPRDAEALGFDVSEPREFDRLRGIAIGASALLRSLQETPASPVPAPEAAAPLASNEPGAPDPSDAGPPGSAEARGADTLPPPDGRMAGGPLPPAAEAPAGGLAASAALGPTVRLSEAGPHLGLGARLGLRVHDYLSVRAGVLLHRQQRLSAGGGSDGFVRDRLGVELQVLARLSHGPWLARGGGLVGLSISTLASAADRSPGQSSTGRQVLVAPVAGLALSGSWQASEDLFVELPVTLVLPLHRATTEYGAAALPPLELSVGIALGFGVP